MNNRNRCSGLKLWVTIFATTFSLLAGAVEKPATKITIGLSPFQDTLLPIIGKEKGWFAEEGLDVDFKTLAWNAVMPAVASSAIDVAVYNTTGVVSVYNKQPDVLFWYPWNIFAQGAALMGRPNINLKTVKDFEQGGMPHPDAVKATIQQLKVKNGGHHDGERHGKGRGRSGPKQWTGPGGLQDHRYGPGSRFSGLHFWDGRRYLGGIPQRTRLNKEGYLTLVTGPDLAPVPLNGWTTTKGFAEKNADALLKLQHVMFRIIRYTDAHQDEIAKTINRSVE